MESLTKPVTLTQDVSKVLDEIRAGADNALYGAGPDVSEALFAKHVVSLIEGAGLPVLQTMHYRWFLRELARLWRTRKGRDLAFHLELCIRKWVGLGLEPRTLQFLICESYERLKGKFEVQSGNDECRTGTADADPAIENRQSSIENGTVPSPSPLAPSAGSSLTPSPSSLTPAPEHSIPRSLDPSIPCNSHSISRSLDPSIPCSSHSIPRSLDPSISSELP